MGVRYLFASLAVAAAVTIPGIAAADPCGFVPPPYVATVPLQRTGVQRTYVFFKDGIETIAIRPGFTGKVEEFGMLVPLPSPPELRKMPDEFFTHIASAIDPPEVVIDLRPQMNYRMAMPSMAMEGAKMSQEDNGLALNEVRVLKQEAVGMYEVAVLEAGSAGALDKWMGDNGFKYPKGMDQACNDYVKLGWCFVAVKTRIGNKTATDPKPGMKEAPDPSLNGAGFDGHVQGMAYRFKVAKPVVGMRLSTFNEAADRRQVVYALTDEPIAFDGVPDERVVRQVPGKKLRRNVTGLLPVRILNGTVKDLTAAHLANVVSLRDPTPHNRQAKDLFASDLLAAQTKTLSLPHEELEKVLLRIGEHMNLRGPEIDAVHERELDKQTEQVAKDSLAKLDGMTLTVIDGEFPFERMRDKDLTFRSFSMKKAANNQATYDARTMGAPPAMGGIRIDDPEAVLGINTGTKSWYEQLWGE